VLWLEYFAIRRGRRALRVPIKLTQNDKMSENIEKYPFIVDAT